MVRLIIALDDHIDVAIKLYSKRNHINFRPDVDKAHAHIWYANKLAKYSYRYNDWDHEYLWTDNELQFGIRDEKNDYLLEV